MTLREAPVLALALLAIDPMGLGGIVLDHPLHERARAFTDALQALLPPGAAQRRVPIGISADRLIGGIDLAATLRTGHVVAERGVLAAADRGVAVFPMAERLTPNVRTVVASVMDSGEVHVARDGVVATAEARVVAVLLDESLEDEAVHASLVNRVAFRVTLDGDDIPETSAVATSEPSSPAARMRVAVRAAAGRLGGVTMDDRWMTTIGETAEAYGIASVRALLMTLRCARAHAAWCGRLVVTQDDVRVASGLVLAHRATRMPAPPAEPEPPEEEKQPSERTPPEPPPTEQREREPAPQPDEPSDTEEGEAPPPPPESESITLSDHDILRAAIAAALPPGLLQSLLTRLDTGGSAGQEGGEQASALRGRPRGARAGMPRGGARLHVLETLRAAAPWQRVRGATLMPAPGTPRRVAIRREDFRVRRFVESTGTTVLFVVDASGSSALNRLAEAKGAIELLLAESYARRDRVSLLAFRGTETTVLLPPTRALARARNVLAAMPGGGGTPMASAIEAAMTQAIAAQRAGTAPLVVMLTDGRANIARDGTPGRPGAERDALIAGRAFAACRLPALFVDTSTRGEAVARRIAESMRARYVLLPAADARALGGLVKLARDAERGAERGA